MDQLYAFSYSPKEPLSKAGWTLYDPLIEYQRMGLGSRTNQWRFSKINEAFQVTFSIQKLIHTSFVQLTQRSWSFLKKLVITF
jgi:hypothetical protein